MAQMTPETGRMVGRLSGNPIPFLIPIVLTIILLIRNPISFNNIKLWVLNGVIAVWSVAVCYKYHDFSFENLSYYFFLFYAIVIAFIHVRVYGRELFPVYEHIMVFFSAISLCLWGISVAFPALGSFFHLFPETANGNNVLYLFNWTDPTKIQVYESIIRNQGCSWEPGRFAIMLIPAILINLSREGITFRGNKNIGILLMALASTMSTTGYSIVMLIYGLFLLQEFNTKSVLTFLFIALPLSFFILSLDFMGEKIQDRAAFEGITRERIQKNQYYSKTQGEEYVGSLDRFESAYLEWMNFQREPLLGYGRNIEHSWFRQNVSKNFVLTGGLVKILSQYGVFVGFLIFILLFHSSVKISQASWFQQRYVFALALLASSISYILFTIPIFTAFWLYGLFYSEEDDINPEDDACLDECDDY